MTKFLQHLFLTTLIALASMGFGGSVSALQSTDLATAQREYDATSAERQELVERLEGLEDRYQGLVAKIEKLKSEGAIRTIGGRIELQNLLSQSKAISDELDGLQTKVRSVDNRLAGKRSAIVGGIDQRLGELERTLGSAAPAARRSIVAELNTLRKRRAAYTTPLPAAPSSRDVDSALRLAEDAAHPDELMAAADELQDTEDQLRKRLEAIDSKIDELRKSRALMRRARSFTREEKFFEETDRERVIARYEKVTVSNPTPPKATNDEPTVTANESAGNDDGASAGNDDFSANNAFETGGMASPAADAEADATVNRSPEPALSDAADGASVAAGQDPFQTSRQTIVIDGGSDPSRAVGSIGSPSSDVEQQIRKLEKEHLKLRKQANELKHRADELRQRASDM